MKNVYLYIVFLLMSFNSFGQGVDVIFFIDNSDSMESKDIGTFQDREYEDLYSTVQNLMIDVLECNSENRVAVVQFSYRQFGVVGTSEERPRIYIEGDGTFKNTSFAFTRRFSNDAGYTFACLDVLKNVLTGVSNPSTPTRVYGAQNLIRTPGNKLVICFFTDAEGDSLSNDLIPRNTSGNTAYASYTSFKNTLNAKFVLILGPGTDIEDHGGLDLIDKKVGAAISSRTGSYSGSVDSYSQDPDGSGVTGRKLLLVGNDPNVYNDANFLLNEN